MNKKQIDLNSKQIDLYNSKQIDLYNSKQIDLYNSKQIDLCNIFTNKYFEYILIFCIIYIFLMILQLLNQNLLTGDLIKL